jgi:hypothetical protein
MALTTYTAATDIIENLGTNPEDRPTLTDETFKAKFDENAANIKAFLNALILELASTAAGKGASAIGVQDAGGLITATTVEAALAELAGTGRTTESLKSLADLLSTHTADLVTDADGVHGLKIESGTWTPILAGATTEGSNTYTTRYGYYQKIGKTVIAHCMINTSAISGMAGSLIIKGLPYAASSDAYRYASATIGLVTGLTYTGFIGAVVRDSQSYINIYNNISQLSVSAATANTIMSVTAIYQTA